MPHDPVRSVSPSLDRLGAQAQVHALRARAGRLPPDGPLPPEILDSWARCDAAGIDFASPQPIRVVEAGELAQRREAVDGLRHLALAELETLMQQIAGSNFMLAFADREGVVLDLYADPRFRASERGPGIGVGSCWSERLAGTNGLGTALALGRSVVVTGPEHYCLRHADIACTASPIHDAYGRIVGALDASSYVESRQRHTQALVQMAASHIENLLLVQQMSAQLVLALHPRREFLGTLSAGLIAFDAAGRVCAHNHRATGLLAGLELAAGTPFEALFDGRYEPLIARMEREHRLGHPAELQLRDRLGSRLIVRPVHLPPLVVPSPSTAGRPLPAPITRAAAAPVRSAPPPPGSAHGSRPPAHQGDQGPAPSTRDAAPPATPPDFIADDPTVQHQIALLAGAVRLRVPVLITGETGTGKELLARHAHRLSGRSGAFVGVNCAAMPESLFEAELFGYAAGAYTGAQRHGHAGLIASADGGTLLLDELGELPPRLQAALLRFLDDQQVRPVGSTRTRQVDVQLVAATHTDLEGAVQAGRFRADLLNRLDTVRLVLPPLRARRDFAALAAQTLQAIDPQAVLQSDGLRRLARQPWPGNLRELRAVLTRALLLRPEGRLDATAFDGLLDDPAPMAALSQASVVDAPAPPHGSALQADACARVCDEHARNGGSVSETARRLGISRTTVYRYLRQGGRVAVSPPRVTAAMAPPADLDARRGSY